jgi:hypothetical protein
MAWLEGSSFLLVILVVVVVLVSCSSWLSLIMNYFDAATGLITHDLFILRRHCQR